MNRVSDHEHSRRIHLVGLAAAEVVGILESVRIVADSDRMKVVGLDMGLLTVREVEVEASSIATAEVGRTAAGQDTHQAPVIGSHLAVVAEGNLAAAQMERVKSLVVERHRRLLQVLRLEASDSPLY